MDKQYIFIFLLTCSLISCNGDSRKTAEALFHHVPDHLKTYDFKNPTSKYYLPYVLEEVSGLSYLDDGILVCVQDEDGKVFFYDHKERKLIREVRFADGGDYEGIQVVGDSIYVAESNGDLYKFLANDEGKKSIKMNTDLKKKNDVEGLAYDSKTGKLIIACKESGDLKDRDVKGRAFYSFDLNKREIDPRPTFTITSSDIKKYLESQVDFEYDENRLNFMPSGIALHPTQDIFYIIASTGKLLLMVNRQYQIVGSVPLDPRLFGQPEGICFAPNGDLFISNEGQGDRGYILKFKMK
ncbi:SdiA-regulated domain-containing protein [Reichenbachiella agarivorans]|uniref:SdiA-regulated domain-containing protein n=1 Tax=Reichenbachiella agarivorans TaxID=2979464 RepID=A0ABY6CSI7_9BACT|nr:SdiA-regulated domain-containing protein [Reichenbachiella agarivorans]UXP33453.1 SdiA-regulated domain-containing protein [Reichenbachiella agarivorans]